MNDSQARETFHSGISSHIISIHGNWIQQQCGIRIFLGLDSNHKFTHFYLFMYGLRCHLHLNLRTHGKPSHEM